jgi:hypothetical protein
VRSPTHTLGVRAALAALVATATLTASLPAAAGEDAAGATVNLCLPEFGALYGGSLARPGLAAMLGGGERLRMIEILPHNLTIRWTNAVTIACNRIEWDSADVYATHYGLEYWDNTAGAYRLCYEETSNTLARVEHCFAPVNTTRVRFTVFGHPLEYDALVLRGFALTPPLPVDTGTATR